MTDISVVKDSQGEFLVVAIEGDSPEGIEFVDAYTVAPLVALDSGRILLRQEHLPKFLEDARRAGLSVE